MTNHPMTVIKPEAGKLANGYGDEKMPTLEDVEYAYKMTGWQPDTCTLGRRGHDEYSTVGCLVGVLAAQLMNLKNSPTDEEMKMLYRVGELTVRGFYGMSIDEMRDLEYAFDCYGKSYGVASIDGESEYRRRGWEIGRAIFGADDGE